MDFDPQHEVQRTLTQTDPDSLVRDRPDGLLLVAGGLSLRVGQDRPFEQGTIEEPERIPVVADPLGRYSVGGVVGQIPIAQGVELLGRLHGCSAHGSG